MERRLIVLAQPTVREMRLWTSCGNARVAGAGVFETEAAPGRDAGRCCCCCGCLIDGVRPGVLFLACSSLNRLLGVVVVVVLVLFVDPKNIKRCRTIPLGVVAAADDAVVVGLFTPPRLSMGRRDCLLLLLVAAGFDPTVCVSLAAAAVVVVVVGLGVR